MKNFNLLQIIPSLESGGAEQGTIDVANFLGEKNLGSFWGQFLLGFVGKIQ